MPGPSHGSQLLPWEHATSGLCCTYAEAWLTENKRSFKKVHAVEWWAVFYESPEGEARHQLWKLDDKNKLVPNGPHQSGWPVYA